MKSIAQYLLILILVIISCNLTSAIPPLDPLNLQSIVWLAQQYQLDIPLNDSICDLQPTIKCTYNSTTSVITQILILDDIPMKDQGAPDPDFKLSFFSMTIFTFKVPNRISNSSINILEMFQLMRNIITLEILNDGYTTYIPPLFPFEMKSIVKLTIQNQYKVTIPQALLTQVKTLSTGLSSFTPNNTINSTLQSLSIYVDTTVMNSLNLPVTSFPVLKTINVKVSPPGNLIVNIGSPITSLYQYTPDMSITDNITLNVANCKAMSQVLLTATPTYKYTFGSNISDCSISILNLQNFYPNTYIPTVFPKTITTLEIENATITRMPPIPDLISTFIINQTAVVGTIPDNFLQNKSLRVLFITNNPGIYGGVPDSFCQLQSISLKGTNITSAPDCFLCYLPSALPTTYPFPSNFTCNITFDKPVFPVYDNNVIVTGNNLGWFAIQDCSIGITTIKYNKAFSMASPLAPLENNGFLNVTLSIAFNYNFSIPVIYADVVIESVVTTQEIGYIQTIISISRYNTDLSHTFYLGGVEFVPTYYSGFWYINNTNTSGTPDGPFSIAISNPYYTKVYPGFIQYTYPIITSTSSVYNSGGSITLTGSFSNNITSSSVLINNVPCQTNPINETTLECVMQPTNFYGFASINVNINGYVFESDRILYISQNQSGSGNNGGGGGNNGGGNVCTDNCNNRGNCLNNTCICNPDYYGDYCEYESFNGNGTFIPNNSTPIATFDYNGFLFNFSFASLQEIDINDKVVNEYITKFWTVNTIVDGNSTTLNYKLKYMPFNLNTTIEFTNSSKTISFGGITKTLPPNSLKISVYISNYQYQSHINTLRVVFKTQLGSSGTIGVANGCGMTTIPDITTDPSGKSIKQFKMVVNNVIMVGNFLSTVISDGRPTIVQNEILNRTMSNTNSKIDNIYIGVNLPYCKECILDPDFAPLLHGTKPSDDCSNDSNNETFAKWKIGVLAGAIGAAIVVIACIAYYKRRVFLKGERRMSLRMSRSVDR